MTDLNYEETLVQDARLVILKELSKQNDGRLNATIMVNVLDSFGHRRSRTWVQEQFNFLESKGAVKLHKAGSILVAGLTQVGQDHIDRREFVDGIAKPSLG